LKVWVKIVYVDTGPLVALLDKRDQYSLWMQEQVSEVKGQWITCESVLVETLYVCRNHYKVVEALKGMILEDFLQIKSVMAESPSEVFSLMLKYHDVDTSLADVCLLNLYNRTENSSVLTTDSDFLIYRDASGQPLNLISPFKSKK